MALGEIIRSIPAPSSGDGLAWDGTNLWVLDGQNDRLIKINPANGTQLGTVSASNAAYGAAYAGGDIYYGAGSNVGVADPVTGNAGGNFFDFPGSYQPRGITWDGSYLWGTASSGSTVHRFTTTGSSNFSVTVPFSLPRGLTFADGDLWVIAYTSGTVYRVSRSNGSTLGSFATPGEAGITWDGSHFWVLDGVTDTIYQLEGPNAPPNAPILAAPADGAGLDRNSTQRFDWDFSDPDADDSQSWYRLRYRLVGAGTWSVVDGSTPNTYRDFAAGTFAAGDYEWQVATRDAQGVPEADGDLVFSSSSFFTAGDAPAQPTITSPVNGGTFLQTQTVEWSTPNQDAYQLQVRDPGDVVVYDTGTVTSQTARSASVPFPDNQATRKLRLRVLDGGLWSPWYEISGTVSWLAPPEPVVSLLADDNGGALAISISNPAPSGEEPAAVYNDVEIDDGDGWVRKATMVAINGIFTYWLPVAGRDYGGNVRVTAVAENGVTATTTTTTTIEPPASGYYGGSY